MFKRALGLTTLFLATLAIVPTLASALVISEFRVRGPNGANDEFIEVYNETNAPVTVNGGGTGYAIAASDGNARAVIPNGTQIPARGHYLAVNSVGYSLASYPAGNGTTATGDAAYTSDIPDNAGIALFNTSVAANFTLANRLDAVGSTAEANTLYKEGTGYPALTPFSINYAFHRDYRTANGTPRDTNNNAVDLVFDDTNGTSAGAGQRLGAPGPENLSSPIAGANGLAIDLLDSTVSADAAPNLVRSFTSDPANNSTFGTLDIRRKITNNTGAPVSRLRFRIQDILTFPAPSGFADLRARTSTTVVVSGTSTGTRTVYGTTLEQPPSQPNGAGYNGSLSANNITLAAPLAVGASVDVHFLLGIQQTGIYRFCGRAEALPGGGGEFGQAGNTDTGTAGNCGGAETDVASGPAENSWSADTTPTFAFGGWPVSTGGGGATTFECSVDTPENYQPCPQTFTTAELAPGPHVLKVRATNPQTGPDAVPYVRKFNIAGAPDTTITGGPADGATGVQPVSQFAFDSSQPGTFQCSVDQGAFATCTSPFTTPTLSPGQHTFRVQATNGNAETDSTPATRTFTVAGGGNGGNDGGGGGGGNVAPETPTGLTAVPGPNTVTLDWADAARASRYAVFRALAGGTFVQIGTTDASRFTDNGLTADEQQCYKVQSLSAASGSSPQSAQVCATPTGPVVVTPPAPAFAVTGARLAGKAVALTVDSTGGDLAIRASAKASGKKLAGGSLIAPVAAGVDTLSVKLPRAVRAARSRGKVKLTYTLTFTPDGATTPIVATRTLTLKRIG